MSKPRKRPTPALSEQLRQIIAGGSMTRYALSKASGVDQAQLSRFIHRTGGLSAESLDAVGRVLRLKLVRQSEVE